MAALRYALAIRRPEPGLICLSDRGSQYCSVDHQAELSRHRIHISMSGKENRYDSALVETFFKTPKLELVWRTVFMARQDAEPAIGCYIDSLYNPVQRHSSLALHKPCRLREAGKLIHNRPPRFRSKSKDRPLGAIGNVPLAAVMAAGSATNPRPEGARKL